MLRFFLSAVALAGILAMQHPALADAVVATAPVHAESATAGQAQSAPAPSEASASDARNPVNAGFDRDAVTVGFGWG